MFPETCGPVIRVRTLGLGGPAGPGQLDREPADLAQGSKGRAQVSESLAAGMEI